MLVPDQIINKKWNCQNKKWYESKGYNFTYYGDQFEVKADDLSKGSKDKVDVICDYCGDRYKIIWEDYYKRKDYGKIACKKCRLKKASESTQEQRRDNLYSRAKCFCDKYGYELLTPKEEVYNADSWVNYKCLKHGIHNVKIYSLITEHRCIDCMHEIGGKNQKLDIDYIMEYIEEHDSKLLNPHEYTRSIDKNLKVICPDCGEIFTTSFFSFRKYDGQRCPDCTNLESKGEFEVRQYLESHNIKYNPQHRFYDCRTSVPLPFDFYLPELNIAIEYDGAGHYLPIRRSSITIEEAERNLEKIQYRDGIKTNYCREKRIKLIRIPYMDFDNIKDILDRNLHDDIV